MRFQKVSPNYVIAVYTKHKELPNTQICVSKAFYSKLNIDEVFVDLKEGLGVSSESGVKVRIRLRDISTQPVVTKNTTFRVLPQGLSVNQTRAYIAILITKLLYTSDYVDQYQNRYRLIVENSHSEKFDRRSFTFNSDIPFDKLLEKIKEHTQKIVKEHYDGTIVFDYEKNQKKTHRIILYRAGSVLNNCRFKGSKSFTIDFPNYSSAEVVEYLLEETK